MRATAVSTRAQQWRARDRVRLKPRHPPILLLSKSTRTRTPSDGTALTSVHTPVRALQCTRTHARTHVGGCCVQVPAQAVLLQVLRRSELAEAQTLKLHQLLTALLDMYAVTGLDGRCAHGYGMPWVFTGYNDDTTVKFVILLMYSQRK
jgi:hypothetical protein